MIIIFKIITIAILIETLKAQDTLDKVCYNDRNNDQCWLQNVKDTQQKQEEYILEHEMKIERFTFKDCSDHLYAGKTNSGVYGIYTRYSRYENRVGSVFI